MPKKRLTGVVVSDKMNKTIVVKVTRKFEHPKYKKAIERSKKYHVHDENNVCKIGDVVVIEETRPLSKTKSWRVVEILKKQIVTGEIPSSEESEGI
ncbi:MAG: 30S ribosomal protein S17 [Pseudothermotoga sp.]